MSEFILFYRDFNQKIKVMIFNEGVYEELSEFTSGYAHYVIDIIGVEKSINTHPENTLHIIEEAEYGYIHYFAVLNKPARLMIYRAIEQDIDFYSCIRRAINKVCVALEQEICD